MKNIKDAQPYVCTDRGRRLGVPQVLMDEFQLEQGQKVSRTLAHELLVEMHCLMFPVS